MTEKQRRIRLLIADDNRAVRRGLRLQLDAIRDIEVIGEATNGADAVTIARNERADVILMDLQMPRMNGIDATAQIMKSTTEHPPAVIVMTSFALDHLVIQALDAGAVGYLLKSHDSGQLVDAVYAASRGDAVVSHRVTASMLKEFVRRGRVPTHTHPDVQLTTAERRVVAALSSGVTSTEDLAAHLHISMHTVRSQLQSAMKKCQTSDRTQLALWGVRHHLVP